MGKKISKMLVCGIAMLFALPSSSLAQLRPDKQVIPKMTVQERQKKEAEAKAKYPLIFQVKKLKVEESAVPKLQTRIPNRPVTGKFETTRSILHATPTEIWGDVTYMETWTDNNAPAGYYTFAPENPIAFNLKHTLGGNFEGAAFVNGKIYGSYILQSFFGVLPYLVVYDPETGEFSSEYMSDFLLMATETAQGADGTVYGQFYNADGSALEYGVIDYAAKTRTTIGTATNPMVAMGVTSDNKLYGISKDGNLYQISIENGTETLIGSTGLTVSDADGYYGQTGEIDPKTNIFYWAEISADASAGFYTVDLTNATPAKIADYSEGVVQIHGMLIPPPAAEDKAPAAATELEANFVREATTGSFEFKAPAKTFDGTENLSGQLGYKVFINGEEKKSGTCNPSSYVSETVTVPEGMNNFVVTVSNAVGNGAKAKLNKWVGFDIPKPATGVTLTANNETGKMDLTWTAPTEGMNGGYMGALKYNVYRIVNGTETQVATAQEGTSFTETVTVGQMSTYSYAVETINGTKTGAKATSNGTVIGSAFEVPYFEDFLTADAAGIYTILDANSDGKTWAYDKNNHSMYSRYSTVNNADDWLFTPPIKLKAGKTYQFSVNAKARLKSFPERFEVKLGTGTTAEAMNIDVIGSTDLLVSSYETFTNDNITVPVDGEYNFGIHAISDADKFQLYIDSVTVEIGPAPTAPAAPEITATPGAAGAMKADLSIKAPAKAINGSALSENMTIKIKRDGTEIHTLTGVAPDAAVTYTDNDANLTAGYHEYVAIPYNSSDIGKKSNKVRIYIGLDTPKKPENTKAVDNQSTTVSLSWDAVTTGVNNGYVDPSGVKYNILNTTQTSFGLDLGDKIADTDQTNFDVTYNCDEGEQDFKYWAINAFNTTGESGYSLAYLIAGAPYTLPMKESFADKKLSYFWMYRAPVSLSFSTDASDNDGYAMSMVSTQSNVEGAFGSGKISLAGATKPTLVFSHKSTSTANTLKVVAVKPDGTTTDVQGITVSKEYAMAKVDLTPYVGERYIRFEFIGGFTEPGTFTFDNINILDMLEHNVATDMTAPKDMKKGQTKDVKVKVSNMGANTASGVSLRVSADDKVFYDKPVADIPSMESVEVAVPYTASVFLTGNSVNLKAEAVYALDLDPDDNVSTATISVEASTANPPTDLTGTQNGDATVTLNWTAPSAAPLDVTENFDSYAPWAIEFGEWTLVDGNPNATTGGFFQSYQYGSQGTPFAFTIMNPNAIFPECLENNPDMTPHSGDQYAMAVYKYIGQDFQNGDEWIISPQLPGIGQTISFFTLNLKANQDYVETFDILYSTTDNDIASFTKIGDTRSSSGGGWKEFSVDLPEGTRHFAIHHNTNSNDAFLFGLDDITYKAGMSDATGYNIYMDGELIGTVSGGNVVTFTADPPSPDGEHTYSVTALYADGSESVPVSITLTTAIDEIFSEGKAHDIYTLDGILVRKQATSADGLKKGVYVIDNKAVVIK